MSAREKRESRTQKAPRDLQGKLPANFSRGEPRVKGEEKTFAIWIRVGATPECTSRRNVNSQNIFGRNGVIKQTENINLSFTEGDNNFQ